MHFYSNYGKCHIRVLQTAASLDSRVSTLCTILFGLKDNMRNSPYPMPSPPSAPAC